MPDQQRSDSGPVVGSSLDSHAVPCVGSGLSRDDVQGMIMGGEAVISVQSLKSFWMGYTNQTGLDRNTNQG